LEEGDGFEDGDGLAREMGCMKEMADALWEGHTLLKSGLSAHRRTDTHRKAKTVHYICQFHSIHLADIIIS